MSLASPHKCIHCGCGLNKLTCMYCVQCIEPFCPPCGYDGTIDLCSEECADADAVKLAIQGLSCPACNGTGVHWYHKDACHPCGATGRMEA